MDMPGSGSLKSSMSLLFYGACDQAISIIGDPFWFFFALDEIVPFGQNADAEHAAASRWPRRYFLSNDAIPGPFLHHHWNLGWRFRRISCLADEAKSCHFAFIVCRSCRACSTHTGFPICPRTYSSWSCVSVYSDTSEAGKDRSRHSNAPGFALFSFGLRAQGESMHEIFDFILRSIHLQWYWQR